MSVKRILITASVISLVLFVILFYMDYTDPVLGFWKIIAITACFFMAVVYILTQSP